MRSMYTHAILAAIHARPGIRTIELAEAVDCDIDAVERAISYELAAGKVMREVVQVAHGRPTCAFRMKPPPPPPPAVPALEKSSKTKVEVAIEFIKAQPGQRATTKQLHTLLGLRRNTSPNASLQRGLEDGVLCRDGSTWAVGSNPPRVRPVAKPKKRPARAYLGEFMCALRANGELHLALGEVAVMRLNAEQTRQVQALLGRAA